MDLSGFDYLVVGAGISGATVARCLTERGKKVVVIEKGNRVGGLCHSFIDPESGIERHLFGTHVLHSSNRPAIAFLKKFCELNHYRHRVYSRVNEWVFPYPINLETINRFFHRDLSPEEARIFLSGMPQETGNFEEACISRMGTSLYETFIKGYSEKQWGVSPKELPESLLQRIPVRFSYNGDYFDDSWQGVPIEGYEGLFSRLLWGITTLLSVDFLKAREMIGGNLIIVYTGSLDEYFGYRFGPLKWRSVNLEFGRIKGRDHQGCAVMNYPAEDVPFTRIHEFRHLHPERMASDQHTIIAREYTSFDGTPAYPVEPEGLLARKYREAAALEKNVYFCGRLGTYRYLNMDQAVAEALELARWL